MINGRRNKSRSSSTAASQSILLMADRTTRRAIPFADGPMKYTDRIVGPGLMLNFSCRVFPSLRYNVIV